MSDTLVCGNPYFFPIFHTLNAALCNYTPRASICVATLLECSPVQIVLLLRGRSSKLINSSTLFWGLISDIRPQSSLVLFNILNFRDASAAVIFSIKFSKYSPTWSSLNRLRTSQPVSISAF